MHLQVLYKVTSDAKALETTILTDWDFPCNHLENTAQIGSYRPIEVCYDNDRAASIEAIRLLRSLPQLQETPVLARK